MLSASFSVNGGVGKVTLPPSFFVFVKNLIRARALLDVLSL